MVAVCLASPDHKEPQANQEDQANQEHQAVPEPPASHPQPLVSPPLHHHANPVPKAHPALLVPQDLPETQERQALLDDQAPTLLQDPLDPEGHPDLPERLDLLDHPESQESLPRASHLPQESPERLETKDHLDHPAHLEHPETMAHPVQPGPRESLVQMEPLAQTASQVLQALQEVQALPERRVSAPSTAPSMEESSSRMELVDKSFINWSLPLFLFLLNIKFNSIQKLNEGFCLSRRTYMFVGMG